MTALLRGGDLVGLTGKVRHDCRPDKGPILQAAIAGAAEVGDSIVKVVMERAAKNINADSYQFRQVMEALFK